MSVRVFSIVIASAILLASGVMHLVLAKDSDSLDLAVARVEDIPKTIGEWQSREEAGEVAAFAQAGAKAYWMRTYTNERTRAQILVILMCGRSGKMAIHTPEVCYSGAGYSLSDPPAVFNVKGESNEEFGQFWTAPFTKKIGLQKTLRLFWSWNSNGNWEAPVTPRLHFRGEPFLYKLYLSRDVTYEPNGAIQSDPSAEFLREFLPVLKSKLFPPAA